MCTYYIEAVESGWAGTKKRGPRKELEEEKVPGDISDRDSINPGEQDESGEGSDKASGGVSHVEQLDGRQSAPRRTADTGLNMERSSTGQLR